MENKGCAVEIRGFANEIGRYAVEVGVSAMAFDLKTVKPGVSAVEIDDSAL
jgi:hypothetical protein